MEKSFIPNFIYDNRHAEIIKDGVDVLASGEGGVVGETGSI